MPNNADLSHRQAEILLRLSTVCIPLAELDPEHLEALRELHQLGFVSIEAAQSNAPWLALTPRGQRFAFKRLI